MIIERKFGNNIAVADISGSGLIAAMEHAPKWWGGEQDARHDILFVIHQTTAKESIEQVSVAPEYEKPDIPDRSSSGRPWPAANNRNFPAIQNNGAGAK